MANGYNRNPNGQPVLPQQCRAGGGISGGGETPSKTLWKKAVFDTWICGEHENNTLKIAGPNENKIFNTDENGKITAINELNQTTIDYTKELFEQYFGVIQTVQSLVYTNLNIGDDIPDWENYENLE